MYPRDEINYTLVGKFTEQRLGLRLEPFPERGLADTCWNLWLSWSSKDQASSVSEVNTAKYSSRKVTHVTTNLYQQANMDSRLQKFHDIFLLYP